MRSIREIFISHDIGRNPGVRMALAYRTLIHSLDYRLRVYQDINNPGDPDHGDVFALFSRRNERQWGRLLIKRGCGPDCDPVFGVARTWDDVNRSREALIGKIIWTSGEVLLNWLHDPNSRQVVESGGFRMQNFRSFVEGVDRIMI